MMRVTSTHPRGANEIFKSQQITPVELNECLHVHVHVNIYFHCFCTNTLSENGIVYQCSTLHFVEQDTFPWFIPVLLGYKQTKQEVEGVGAFDEQILCI